MVKYAYMCHFYANPVSILLAEDGRLDAKLLQPEHLEAIRSLDSTKSHVEAAVEARQLNYAQSILENDEYLVEKVLEQNQRRKDWVMQLLRSLQLISATGLLPTSFTDLYITALEDGIDLSSEAFPVLEPLKRLGPSELLSLIRRLSAAIQAGSPELDLESWESDADDLLASLSGIEDEIEGLIARAKENGNPLKSKYSAQSRILRTTVVAQKVQLSHDTAKLTEEDNAFTEAIDKFAELLSDNIHSDAMTSLPLQEAWAYDSKLPYRDAFIPRPGTTFGRALSRPHDYLACSCCRKTNGTLAATLPTTSILYNLYREAGALVNVADLWSAYYALVGDESDVGLDERAALVQFYRGLGELRTMGFVKQSKKKADHIAKLKWL